MSQNHKALVLQALRHIYRNSQGKEFPIYVGFATPAELLSVASVPVHKDEHADIADDVKGHVAPNPTPLSQWQRDLETSRRDDIKRVFDGDANIMPNAVMLAQNPKFDKSVNVKQRTIGNTAIAELYEISIQTQPKMQEILWVLDGQHRLQGLSLANKPLTDKIPFVLLLSAGAANPGYDTAMFARVFAQVSTGAKGLEPVHQEWLSRAFSLGKYGKQNGREWQDSLDVVIELASKQNGSFYNSIQFNPNEPVILARALNAFEFNCVELAKLVHDEYYSQGGSLSPDIVASALSNSHDALKAWLNGIPSSTDNAFDQWKILAVAFWQGVLTFIRTSTKHPSSSVKWMKVLENTGITGSGSHFHDAWDLSRWVLSLRGESQEESSRLASSTFRDLFAIAAGETSPWSSLLPPRDSSGTPRPVAELLGANATSSQLKIPPQLRVVPVDSSGNRDFPNAQIVDRNRNSLVISGLGYAPTRFWFELSPHCGGSYVFDNVNQRRVRTPYKGWNDPPQNMKLNSAAYSLNYTIELAIFGGRIDNFDLTIASK